MSLRSAKESANLVSKKMLIGAFHRYQMKCKSVSKKSPRYKFEAIFLRNMLKEMRKTNELFDSKDNPFNSDSVRMMQGFYDDELCNTLAQQHGIGIAAMIVKQLSPKHK